MTSNVHGEGSPGLATKEAGNTHNSSSVAIELPSVESILSKLENPASLTVSGEPADSSSEEEEKEGQFLRTLQEVLSKTEGIEGETSFDVQELCNALETAGDTTEQGMQTEAVASILHKLWRKRSRYMVEATEALANASRDRESSTLGLR